MPDENTDPMAVRPGERELTDPQISAAVARAIVRHDAEQDHSLKAIGRIALFVLGGGAVGGAGVGSVDWLGMDAVREDVARLDERLQAIDDEIDAVIQREHGDRQQVSALLNDVDDLKSNMFAVCLKVGADCRR